MSFAPSRLFSCEWKRNGGEPSCPKTTYDNENHCCFLYNEAADPACVTGIPRWIRLALHRGLDGQPPLSLSLLLARCRRALPLPPLHWAGTPYSAPVASRGTTMPKLPSNNAAPSRLVAKLIPVAYAVCMCSTTWAQDAQPEQALPSITVKASRNGNSDPLEALGRTKPSAASTGLLLTPRETPQSMSTVEREQIEQRSLTSL